MMNAHLVGPGGLMLIVAALALAASVYTFTRPARDEAAIYRIRIAGTMMAAGAVILTGYAIALMSWGAER